MSASKEDDDTSFDWRTTGHLNPIRNQGGGNSCFAFAVCGVLEVLHRLEIEKSKREGRKVKHEDRITLSPQDIYDSLIHDHIQHKRGRTIDETIAWVRENGCVLEHTLRYNGWFRKRVPIQRQVYLKLTTSLLIILKNDLLFKKEKQKIEGKKLEKAIRIAPVIGQLIWFDEMSRVIKDAIYSGPSDPKAFEKKMLDYHAVMIVGFGQEMVDKKLTKYWLIRNSYGTKWGMQGYAKIDRSPCHGKLLIENAWIIQGVTYPGS